MFASGVGPGMDKESSLVAHWDDNGLYEQPAGTLRERVAAEIKTTFASHYTHEVNLEQALSESALKEYALQATGKKYLVRPDLQG